MFARSCNLFFYATAVIPSPLVWQQITNDPCKFTSVFFVFDLSLVDDFKDVELPTQQTDWEGLNTYGFSSARGGNLFLALECMLVNEAI
jgi:hypothetical protein